MRWSNYHVHSVFCDGKNTLKEMAQAAEEAGITSLGFSGHAPLIYANDWTMKEEEVPDYLKAVQDIKALYQGKMSVYTGMEIDYYMDLKDISPYVHSIRDQLDYCIGSIHVMGLLPDGSCSDIDYTTENFEMGIQHCFKGSPRNFVETYYQSIGDMAETVRPEIIGHLDLLKKNNPDQLYFDETSDWYREAALTCLERIRETSCIIEVNTGGMARYGSRCLYPSDWLLEQIHDMGIPILLNGDSHQADAIAYAYKPVLEKLLQMRFKEMMLFDGTQWIPQKIELD